MPYYLVTLVLHDQGNGIAGQVAHLDAALQREGLAAGEAVHTAPLIRREPPYENMELRQRRRLFSHLEHFIRHCPIQEQTIALSKREFGYGDALAERIARELGLFLRERLAQFQAYDCVIVYYDRGQKQLTKVLRLIFSSALTGVEFRTVTPSGYRLFQAADFLCTLELLDVKCASGGLTPSELAFFGSVRALRKDHLKLLGGIRVG